MDGIRLFFSPFGRIGRSAFWLATVATLLALIPPGFTPYLNGPAWLGLGVIALYCTICIRAKRLHDLGYSGWWQAAPMSLSAIALTTSIVSVVAIDGGFTPGAIFGGFAALSTTSLSLMVDLAFLIWLGSDAGDGFDNPYGAQPPLGARRAALSEA